MIKACLLGKKLGHSLSPVIHEKFFELTGIKGSYQLHETQQEKLGSVIKELGEKDFRGANVTIPFKTDIIQFLDDISEEAQAIGAVNTILFSGGKTKGFNTDYYGLKNILDNAQISIEGRVVAVLGTGGASKCAVKLAKDMNAAQILIVSRNPKSKEISYQELGNEAGIDVLVNTTPAGMYPDVYGCPVSNDVIEKSGCVVDIVYNPMQTQLMKKAQAMGKKTAGGLLMLTSQAIKAQEIWNDEKYNENIYKEVYEYVRDLKTNIVIIGMPGSGKSSIGKAVSEKLGKNFIDTDELIEQQHGSISDIFNKKGEPIFREYERQAAKLASDIRGAVIATGGGIILDKSNIDQLKKTGLIVFIDRPLSVLIKETDGSGRPLIADDNNRIKELYEKRYGLYNKYADVVVNNDEDIDKCANKIIEAWGSGV